MINRIITSILFICLLFALVLSLSGVEAPIKLGPNFRIFLAQCSSDLENFTVQIPSIPSIPSFEVDSGFLQFVDYLRNFVNFLVLILNFLIVIINYIIELLEFIAIIFKNLITFKNNYISA